MPEHFPRRNKRDDAKVVRHHLKQYGGNAPPLRCGWCGYVFHGPEHVQGTHLTSQAMAREGGKEDTEVCSVCRRHPNEAAKAMQELERSEP